MFHTRPGTLLATVATILALSASVFAQEKGLTTTPGASDTARVIVSGNQTTDYVHRDKAITAWTDSQSNNTGTGNTTGSRTENTFEGEMGIRFTAELTNKITGVVEVGSRRFDGSPDPTTGDGGLNRFGDGEAFTIRLKEMHLNIPTLLIPSLRAQLGITTWKFNPRGKGGALAFDPRNSQTVTRNLDSGGAAFNRRDDAVNRLIEAAFMDPSQPVGGTLTWQDGPMMFDVVLLPAVNDENGTPSNDDQFYALDGLMNLDSLGAGSRAGVILAITSLRTDAVDTGAADAGRTRMITVGGGSTIHFMDSLEFYFEAYFQMGKAGELASRQRVEAGGNAVRLGLQWNHAIANPMPIWANVEFTHISGENTDPADVTNRKASRFAAYEGVNDLMIMEDPYFGFDWDSNLQAVKVSGGLSLTTIVENDLDLMFIVGVLRTAKRMQTPIGLENKLGNELDIRMTWHMTKQFSLRFSLAYLWGSRILEQAMQNVPGNENASDSSFLFVIGWDLTF